MRETSEVAFKAAKRWFLPGTAMTGRMPVVTLCLCSAALVVAIFLLTLGAVGRSKERALVETERELTHMATMLARHLDRQFDDSAIIASDIIERLNVRDIPAAAEFRAVMATEESRRVFRSKGISYVGDISFFDAAGDMISWSHPVPAPRISIAKRAYFERIISDATVSTLVETVPSLVSGNQQTVIAHRLTGVGGVFLGVMIRRIAPAQFEEFLASIGPGSGSAVTLLQSDGTLLARYPQTPHLVGSKLPGVSLVSQLADDAKTLTVRGTGPVDGVPRLAAGVRLNHFPGVVVAAKTTDAALADWTSQSRATVLAAVLAALAVAGVMLLVVRQIVLNNRENRRRLELERERLDTALNGMVQGLVVYDRTGVVTSINLRYFEMFDFPTDTDAVGWHFRDLMAERQRNGHFDGNVDAFCSTVMRAIAKGRVDRISSRTKDGRTFLAVNRPLSTGGWVATIEDTTERTQLEHERDRNIAFVREIIDHIPSLITVKDAQTRRYLLVNRNAETHFGFSAEMMVGKTAFEFFDESEARLVTAEDERTISSRDNIVTSEHVCVREGLGERYLKSRSIGIRDAEGCARYIINVLDDETERRLANARIAHLAHYDALTGLPNRVLFRTKLEERWAGANQGKPFALLYIDIDGFKGINDTLGHHVGDGLLQQIADRLRACLEDGDLIARLGGDEFAVVMDCFETRDAVADLVGKLQRAVRNPFEVGGHRLSSDASIGIAIAPNDAEGIEDLIRHADLAMYAAKLDGRRTHRFFERLMTEKAKARLLMEQELRKAISAKGFEVRYQPIVDLNGAIVCCEALLRWRHPVRGMISPAEFIPIAEETGLITELGSFVLRVACAEAAAWPAAIRIAINVSPMQLKAPSFALTAAGALMSAGLDPGRLVIEITEAVLIGDDDAALPVLHELRGMGIKIALDDFGTGYSSLSYLRRFPFEEIKIDRSFVNDLGSAEALAVVEAVVNIAAASGMTTTAEGVETEAQRMLLSELGCTHLQGYLFSAAMPGVAIAQRLRSEEPLATYQAASSVGS